jgi:hypothetical protein
LQWIFLLLEWLAKNWPMVAKDPDIVERTPMVIGKLKEKSRTEIVDFALYFRDFLPV